MMLAFDRNDGYYVSASLLCKAPYDYRGIWRFMGLALPEANHVRADMMSVRESYMSPYSAMMSNGLELQGNLLFTPELLEEGIVSRIRMDMSNGLHMELNVGLLDEESYEVSLSIPVSDIQRMDAYPYFENMAKLFATSIQPIYGNLGIEANICGFSEIREREFFSANDQLYFCSHLLETSGSHIDGLLQGYTRGELPCGSYWSRGDLDDGLPLPRDIQHQLGHVLADYLFGPAAQACE